MNRDHAVEALQEAAVKAKKPRVAASRCSVKRKRKFVPEHAMKACVRVEVHIHAFLISAVDGHGRSASRPGIFTAVEKLPVSMEYETGLALEPCLVTQRRENSLSAEGKRTVVPRLSLPLTSLQKDCCATSEKGGDPHPQPGLPVVAINCVRLLFSGVRFRIEWYKFIKCG